MPGHSQRATFIYFHRDVIGADDRWSLSGMREEKGERNTPHMIIVLKHEWADQYPYIISTGRGRANSIS